MEGKSVLFGISASHRLGPLKRLKLFLALSRTPHGILDMTAPAIGALLVLGKFPPLGVTLLGLLTAFAGYTAVYALNDVVDYRVDKEKVERGCLGNLCSDLDSVFVRHPLAQGLLSYREGLLWTLGWAVVAFIGAYLLNPICVLIFIGGCLLEAIYCKLWQVSAFKSVVNGSVKTLGALAAVFAVDPSPSPYFVITLFLLLFFWEIGGQNIPNDLMDIDDDRNTNGRTVPICFGLERSKRLVLLNLLVAVVLSGFVFYISPAGFGWFHYLLLLGFAGYLLVWPALSLYRNGTIGDAAALFNRSSYYPLALLFIVVLKITI